MPASSADGIAAVEESLRSSLGPNQQPEIEEQLLASSKRILLHRIDFKPAQKKASFQLDSLRTKYTPLNPSSKTVNGKSHANGSTMKKEATMAEVGEGLPSPKVWLYPPEKIQLDWPSVRRVGAGLWNMGNTCFLNSILQCLSYTPPLVNYLITNEHKKACTIMGFCILCELQKHIQHCFEQPGRAIKPFNIIHRLKLIAKHMHIGRQEDAHEFLRYTVDHMQKSCLNGFNKIDKFSKDTTFVNQIFGGYLRSQVVCCRCHGTSNTYDPFQDLSLDIKNGPSLQRALEKFVQPESLSGENAYNCARCGHKVTAHKRFSVHKPPIVLTLQLKRFDFNRVFGGKVTKHISFPEKLNLRPFMSITKGEPVLYHLYGVVVHQGMSTTSGHYYSYIKAPNKMWYCMNDNSVEQRSTSHVLGSQAYLLFYIRDTKPSTKQVIPHRNNSFIGPKLPVSHTITQQPSTKVQKQEASQQAATHMNDIGKPVIRAPNKPNILKVNGKQESRLEEKSPKKDEKPNPIISHQPPQKTQESTATVTKTKTTPTKSPETTNQVLPAKKIINGPSTIPLLAQRTPVAFGIATKQKPASSLANEKTAPVPAMQPRIIMKIKHGKVITDNKSKQGLVPYNDGDSESDQDAVGNERVSPKTGKVTANGPVDVNPSVHTYMSDKNKSKDPVMDSRLNATTTVPGAYGPLDKHDRTTFASPTKIKRLNSEAKKDDLLGKKRPVLSPLTCSTSHPLQRASATTAWHVMDQESQISPSLASGSSNTSVNSTTEWHISEKGKQSKKENKKNKGWTITESPVPSSVENGTRTSDHVTNDVKSQVSCKEFPSPAKLISSLDFSKSDAVKVLPHPQPVKAEESITLRKGDNNQYQIINKSSSNEKSPKLKQDDSGVSYKVSADNKSLPNQTVEKIKLEKVAADTPSTTDSGFVSCASKKHKKKHKKHRDRSHEDETASHKEHKKKKKKKHKHKESDSVSPLREDDEKHRKKHRDGEHKFEEDTNEERYHKKPKHKDSDHKPHQGELNTEDKHHKFSAFEWVEKTKKSMEARKHPASDKAKTNVHVQKWDEHIKDSQGHHKGKDAIPRVRISWDGTKHSSTNVVSELEKWSSSRGYGAAVSSWEGSRSHLDQEVDQERRKDRRRKWSDDYEEELDQGKVKKMKKSHKHDHEYHHDNPFQRQQDFKNRERHKYKNGRESSSSREHGDRHHSRHYRTSSHYPSHKRHGYH